MLRLLVAEVLVGMVLLSGCGKKSTTITAPDGGKVTVDQQSGQTTTKIQGANGENVSITSGQKVTIPKDFPTDIPIYTGATPMAVISTPDGQNLSLQSSDPVAKVLKFYQDELAKNGWKVQATVNAAGGSMTTATKDKRQIVVNVSADNGKTIINLMVTNG